MRQWALVIGSDDVSDAVSNGAVFVEVASSASGSANFTVAGNRPSIIVGASVTLSRNSVLLWEGTVASINLQTDANANITGLLVAASPLAAQLQQAAPVVVTSPTDIGQIASSIVAQTTIPWGGSLNYGVEPGTLHTNAASDGLSALALLANKNWRVQNGSATFVDASNGISSVPGVFTVSSQAYPSIVVHGGLDATAQIPLLAAYQSPTVAIGQPRQATIPEIADQVTLDLAGNVLVQRYGDNYVSGFVSLPAGFQGRAGDWISDTNGVQLPIQQLTYFLVGGDFIAKIIAGYPALQLSPQFSVALAAAAATAPPTRLHGDYLISGGGLTVTGTTAALLAGVVSLSDVQYSVPAANLTLPATGTVQINATATAYVIAPYLGQPGPGSAVPMYLVTMGAVPGIVTLYSRGSVSSNNIVPNAIQTQHITPLAIQALNVLASRYSTDLNNLQYASAQQWGSLTLARNVTVADTLANGDQIIWDVGTSLDTVGDPVPAFSQTLTLAAGASILAIFKHQSFQSGANGIPIVLFTGSSVGGGANTSQAISISGASYPIIAYRQGNRNNPGGYTTDTNGAVVTYSTPANTIAPSASTPLVLTLSQLMTQTGPAGNSAINVQLVDPGGTVRLTSSGVVGPSTVITYNTGGFAAGSWTWKIQGVITSDNGSGPTTTFKDSWNGNHSYYIPGTSGGQVYILNAAGVAQRTSIADDDITFTHNTYKGHQFQITNSAASALTFTLGFDISGL